MTSKIAQGGGGLDYLGPPSLNLGKHSAKYFRAVRFPSCSKAFWRKVRPHLDGFRCFFFQFLAASFRARGAQEAKTLGG